MAPEFPARESLFRGERDISEGQLGPFVAYSSEAGEFELAVRAPESSLTDYYVLFVALDTRASAPLPAVDRHVVEGYFAEYESLLENSHVRLIRCQVSPNRPTRVQCVFDAS